MTSGTLKIRSISHYYALIITEKALATMVSHYGTIYHVTYGTHSNQSKVLLKFFFGCDKHLQRKEGIDNLEGN